MLRKWGCSLDASLIVLGTGWAQGLAGCRVWRNIWWFSVNWRWGGVHGCLWHCKRYAEGLIIYPHHIFDIVSSSYWWDYFNLNGTLNKWDIFYRSSTQVQIKTSKAAYRRWESSAYFSWGRFIPMRCLYTSQYYAISRRRSPKVARRQSRYAISSRSTWGILTRPLGAGNADMSVVVTRSNAIQIAKWLELDRDLLNDR